MSDIRTGFWDVCVNLNVSDDGLIESYHTDAPTCQMVVEIGPSHSDHGRTNHHQSDECRLCAVFESYVENELKETNGSTWGERQ